MCAKDDGVVVVVAIPRNFGGVSIAARVRTRVQRHCFVRDTAAEVAFV